MAKRVHGPRVVRGCVIHDQHVNLHYVRAQDASLTSRNSILRVSQSPVHRKSRKPGPAVRYRPSTRIQFLI